MQGTVGASRKGAGFSRRCSEKTSLGIFILIECFKDWYGFVKEARPKLNGQLSKLIVCLKLRLLRFLQTLNSFTLHIHLHSLLTFFFCNLFLYSFPNFPGGQDSQEGVLTSFTFLRSKPGLRSPRLSSKRPCVHLARSLMSSWLSWSLTV